MVIGWKIHFIVEKFVEMISLALRRQEDRDGK